MPYLSPGASGVGDYAIALARQLRARFSIDTVFVVGTPPQRRSAIEDEFAVRALTSRTSSALVRALEESPLAARCALLQLSPYGYDPNGCPFWLARGLREWLARGAGRHRLITMFHELYAEGPPWTRTFWVSGLQKRATRAILHGSHFAMAGVEKWARQLESWRGEIPVKVLPVPSNVGEPESVPPIAQRRKRICVFGMHPGILRLDSRQMEALGGLVRGWSIEEIAVVGNDPVESEVAALGARVQAHAGLDAAGVGRILSDSILGLSWYPPEVLAKSGVFAAYCAYGVPALVLGAAGRQPPSNDGLRPGVQFLAMANLGERRDPVLLQDVSSAARAWYSTHGLDAHARLVRDFAAA